MQIKLRDYQRKTIDKLIDYFINKKGNPCVVLPTGAGKSIVMAKFIEECITKWPSLRFCVVAHVKELVKQNAEKMKMIMPDADIGIYSAGLKQKDKKSQITFASIQSIYNKTFSEVGDFDVLLVDEAHRIPVSGEGQYRKFIDDQKSLTKGFKVAGFTATPYRLKGGQICHRDNILNKICYEAPIKELIEDGYLCKPVSLNDDVKIDTSDVKTSAGDFNLGELNQKVVATEIVNKTVKEIVTHTENRKKVIIFAVSVEHAELLSLEFLENYGIACPVVSGESSSDERDCFIEGFNDGTFKYLVNCMVLTEGFDSPGVDCVAIVRPTKSPGLYMQMCGRGLRLHPDKEDCLVLDFGDNINRHGPIDDIKPPRRSSNSKIIHEGLHKFCPSCDEEQMNPLAFNKQECPNCGFMFINIISSKIDLEASTASVLSNHNSGLGSGKWFFVDKVIYKPHIKADKPPSLRVEYFCGINVFKEWVCINHDGYVKKHAYKWLSTRLEGDDTPPKEWDDLEKINWVINKAYSGSLIEPLEIFVAKDGKYDKIKQFKFY